MTSTIYVVQFESRDGYEQDGPHSVWRNYGDAEAARGEAYAMDPEGSYSVEEIVGDQDIAKFWFNNPQPPTPLGQRDRARRGLGSPSVAPWR